MKSAAEPVGFAVFFGFVMLLAILGEPVMPGNGKLGILGLGRALGFLAATMFSVQAVNKRRMCGVAVLAFRVFLRSLLLSVFVRHHCSYGIASGTTHLWSG